LATLTMEQRVVWATALLFRLRLPIPVRLSNCAMRQTQPQ
jgi:hypothetical protein